MLEGSSPGCPGQRMGEGRAPLDVLEQQCPWLSGSPGSDIQTWGTEGLGPRWLQMLRTWGTTGWVPRGSPPL